MGAVITNGAIFDGLMNGGKAVQSLDITGSQAADKAIQAQTAAANQANNTQKYIYDQQRADLAPWQAAGTKALSEIQGNKFMDSWQQDPGYDFRLQEGEKAVNSSVAMKGLGNSGAALKALTRYGQDYGSNEYQNVYNRNYSRLSGLAGLGTNAAQGQVQAAGNYGNAVASNQIGLGNGVAAATIGQSNRMGQLIGQGVGGAAAFSDMNLKTDINEVSKADLDEMKSHLKAFSFHYKSDEHGVGEWVGVMAQDLQKSKLGRTLVIEDENGLLQLDVRKVMSLFLATMAEA